MFLARKRHVLAATSSVAVNPSAAYQTKIISDGAAAYWPLDEVGGTVAHDLIGTRHGTIHGAVLLNQAGVNGSRAISFPADGLSNIGLPSLPGLGAAFSFEVWCNPSLSGFIAINRQFIARVIQTDGDFDWGIEGGTTNLRLQYFSASYQYYRVPVTLTAGVWNHYVLTVGGGQAIAYVNGVAQTPMAMVSGGTGNNVSPSIMGDTQVGAEQWGWRGLGQDVAIYEKVLTPAQVLDHYNTRLGITAPITNPFTLLKTLTATPGINGGTTSPIDTTGGTIIVVSVSNYAGPLVSFTDSKGNTYTQLTVQAHGYPNNLYYCLKPVVGTNHTFTAEAATTYPSIVIYVFGGPPSPVFQSENGAFGLSPVQTGSVTPSIDGALIVSGLSSASGTSATIDSGFTSISIPDVGGISVFGAAAYLIQSAAASINPTWTKSGSNLEITIAAFLPKASPLTGYPAVVIADGASNYWRLDETSGLVAVDLIGGKNGTISGGVTLNQSSALSDGKAMGFDGSTGSITLPAMSFPTNCSIEAWIKTTYVAAAEPVISNWLASGAGTYFGTDQGKLFVFSSIGAYGPFVADGNWHHIVYVVQGTNTTIYVDGVAYNAGASGHITTVPVSMLIANGGGGLPGDFWHGSLDEVAIYPLILTPAQIAAHYALR